MTKLPFAKPPKTPKRAPRPLQRKTSLSSRSPLSRGEGMGRKPRKTLKSSGRIKAKPRTPSEKARIYGTPEHIAWMRSLPCAFCGISGYSVVAHTRNGGVSKKADWEHTVPACENVPVHGLGAKPGAFVLLRVLPGCHDAFDKNKKTWRAKYDTDAMAARYAAAFRQSHVAVHPERK